MVHLLRSLLFAALSILSLFLCVIECARWAWGHPQFQISWGQNARSTIHSFEQLNIDAIGALPDDEFKLARRVDSHGYVDLPLVGKLKASGRTCVQFSDDVSKAYFDGGFARHILTTVEIAPAEVPHWVVVLLSMLLPSSWIATSVRHWMGRRRSRRTVCSYGFCPGCGYDLRASPGRCPECGSVPVRRKPESTAG